MKQEFLEIWGLLRKWKWRALLYEPTGNSLLQFSRYLIVGGSAFVADALTLRLVEQCGVYYLIAAAAGFLVGVTVNYFLSTHLAFAGMQARVSRQAELAVFLLISLLCASVRMSGQNPLRNRTFHDAPRLQHHIFS